MKYYLIIVALLATLITTSSARSEQVFDTNVGGLAPVIRIEGRDSDIPAFDLSDLRGEYVLLTFWQSTDASSRRDCNAYSQWAGAVNADKQRLQFVAINFDDNESLFREISKRDGLDREMQYNVQGAAAAAIIAGYRLDGGLGTLLIGPDGRVIARNPSRTELASI